MQDIPVDNKKNISWSIKCCLHGVISLVCIRMLTTNWESCPMFKLFHGRKKLLALDILHPDLHLEIHTDKEKESWREAYTWGHTNKKKKSWRGGSNLSIYRKANSSFYLYMHQYSLSYITLGKEIWKNIIACNLDNLVYYKQFKVQKQKHFHCTVAGVIL